MLKIAICDDSVNELEETYAAVKKYSSERTEWDISVQKFRYGSDLLNSIDIHGRYNIYILDIVMPELNGIELGAEIRRRDNESRIILLTASAEYAIDSYSISATNYILKPCTEQALFAALDKVVNSMAAEQTRRYLMNVADGVYAIPYGRLLYVEYYKHKLTAHMVDGAKVESVLLREPFTKLIAPLIEDGRFVRVSASYVVNMQYVRRFTSRHFELVNGEILSLSRVYLDARNTYLAYVFNKGMDA